MSNKKKKQRRLGRKCPECGGGLDVVTVKTYSNGVEYSEKMIECSECGYYEKYQSSHRKKKREYDSDLDW